MLHYIVYLLWRADRNSLMRRHPDWERIPLRGPLWFARLSRADRARWTFANTFW